MKRAIKVLIPVLLSLAIILCLAWYLFIYDREFTRDVLLSSARYFESQGSHRVAAWFYDCAYAQAGNNEAVAIELAQQHKKAGNYTRAEYTLSKAIEDGGGVELYIALSRIYVEQDKILDAVKLLDGVLNPEIKTQLDALRPAAPTVTPEPGFYSQYASITLQAESGKLYVNNTAEYPSIYDDLYSDPIALAEGENTIYALTVADNGLVSPLSVFGYTVGGVIEELTFADSAIETAIRTQLNFEGESKLYTNDLWDILSFTVPSEATTLADLTYLPFLEELTIAQGPSGELSILSSLSNLTTLTITDTSIASEELPYIGNLPKLERLTLSGCSLSTSAGLEKAVNLKYLDLSNNTIRNIDALGTMLNLQQLNLKQNTLTDLQKLSALKGLMELDVSYNALSSIAPICSITGLTWLEASNNSLTDLAQINNLTGLTHLGLSSNRLTDVSLVSACTKLNQLNISNNELTDISTLSTLVNLSAFNFSNNQIAELPAFLPDCLLVEIDGSNNLLTSLESLSGLKYLNNVYMDYNPELDSVEPLSNCPVLILVNVYGTKVTEVSSLTDQSIIVHFDPTQED